MANLKMSIKKWYVNFLAKDSRSLVERIFYFSLFQLSFFFGACVWLRNFLYDNKIIATYKFSQTVISIGGLSWAGTGKTPLALYLCKKLQSLGYKACIVRRGYGDDENKMLKTHISEVYVAKDRVELLRKHSEDFDIFIIDDGFQYRRLVRDIDVVMMTACEWSKKLRLIPAGPFREPLASLHRASLLCISHATDQRQRDEIVLSMREYFPELKIFFSRYSLVGFFDTKNKEIEVSYFRQRKIAALAGIGYPQGFFNLLLELGIKPQRTFIYPDHYELSDKDIERMEQELSAQGISEVIITEKDFYHIPQQTAGIRFIVMKVAITIENEEEFLSFISDRLTFRST
jgi:tetraacyldisaccharide 4'-kinase